MTMAVQGLDLDDHRLRECSYIFFAVMARVFEVCQCVPILRLFKRSNYICRRSLRHILV